MVAYTQRFGLSRFGGPVDGSIDSDGGKFSNLDRRVIDRVLAALEDHDHKGGTRLADPATAPVLELDTSGGNLPAGTTLYYRVAYVDRYGLETAAGDEVSVDTPSPIPIPGAPGLNAIEGGTLAEGLWWYALTAVAGDRETPLGPAQLITISDWKTVEVTAVEALPDGADAFAIWRQGPVDSGFTRIAEWDGASAYVDDGSIPSDPCPTDPLKLPPSTNNTGATSRVKVTIPEADAQAVERWRIYRSEASGVYQPSALVAEVVETTEEGGDVLVHEFWDEGAVLEWGQPLETSQTLRPSVEIQGGDGKDRPLLLQSPDAALWRVVCNDVGALVTRASESAPSVEVWLQSPAGTWFALGIANDGALVTDDEGEPGDGDFAYLTGSGPLLPSPDPTVQYRLEAADDGALETVLV